MVSPHSQDFCRDQDPGLPSMSLKAFAGIIFRHCPGLAHLLSDKQAIFAQFSAYKQAVPVMGAILLNASMDKCLLIRGYKEGSSWGFPRGKLAKDETDAECAVREVRFLSWPAMGRSCHAWHADCTKHMPDVHMSLYGAYSAIFVALSAICAIRLTVHACTEESHVDCMCLLKGAVTHSQTGTGKLVTSQVREETGLDITAKLVEEDRIERHIKQQRSKLFIITGVLCCRIIVLPRLRSYCRASLWPTLTSYGACKAKWVFQCTCRRCRFGEPGRTW